MSKEKKKQNMVEFSGQNMNLIQGNILVSLILFSIPLLISNIFQQLYNAADTMIVARFLGDKSLAAIGASTAVYELLVGFSLGVGNGMSLVAARCFGSGDQEKLKKVVAGAVTAGTGLTVVLMVIARLGLHSLLEFLGTPADIIEETYSYIYTIVICAGVMFAYNLLSGLLRAIGNSIMPLVFLVLASVINVVLDYIFITDFAMGVRGAAVATVIAQGISALLCLVYIWNCSRILIPEKKHFRVESNIYGELLGQGLSMGLMSGIVSSGTVVLQTAINDLGYLIIAGHTAARKIQSFVMTPVIVLAMASSTFVSQNRGAGKKDRILKGVRYANLLSIFWGIFMTVLLAFFAEAIVRLLTGSSESVVLKNGAAYLRWNAPFYMVLGVLLNLRNSLQGLGCKVMPLISSMIELIGKCIFVAALIPKFQYYGVIFCEPIIWVVMCSQLIWTYRHEIARLQ